MLRHRLPPIAILLLALALRQRGLETTGLWGDQAFTLNTAMRWVNGGAIPLASNKSSVGFVNPPMIEYLYAAALAVWPDVFSVSLLTLLGGLAAVAITGAVTARLFGRRAGLWAMLAHAVAPWAVFWSQLIWNQTMVPPFATVALGGLLLYLAYRPRAVYLIVAFAAASAMTQVHPGTAVQVGTMGLSLLLFRRRVNWWHVAAGAAVFVALYIPYILYQFGVGWGDFRAMGGVAGQESSFSTAAVLLSLDLIRSQGLYRAVPGVVRWDALAVSVFAATLALTVWRWWRPAADDESPAAEPPTAAGRAGRSFVSRISYLVSPAAISAQPPERVALTIILLWFLMPLLFYLRSSVYLQNYYLVGQWPAHFMILGIGLDTAQRASKPSFFLKTRFLNPNLIHHLRSAAGWALPLLFLASAAFQVHFTLRYQDARAAGDGPDMQVRHARAMIATSRELLAADAGSRLVGLGRGHQVENSNLALLAEFVDPARVLLADGDLALPRPAAGTYYLDTRPGSAASETLAARAEPLPDAAIPVKEQLWRFFRWPHGEQDAADAPADAWQMGLALAGHTREPLAAGQPLWVELAWRVAERPPNVPYHFGVYLLDEHDNVVAQHDGPGFDSIQWRPGDSFITYHLLPIPDDLPPGRYRLAAALYTWPELARAELISGGNTAYIEEIDFTGEE